MNITFKRLAFWGSLIGLLVFGVVSCRNCQEVDEARTLLLKEINVYYSAVRVQAAKECLTLMDPYLSDCEKREYAQQISSVANSKPQVFLITFDVSAGKLESMMYGFGIMLRDQVRGQLGRESVTSHETMNELVNMRLKSTPQSAIYRISSQLGQVAMLEDSLLAFDGKDFNDLLAIEKHRQEFDQARVETDDLIRRHGKPLSTQP